MSTVLPDLSEALADAVSAASDGLVRVEGRDRLLATGIVWDAEGLIVTSHHALERDENINVGFQMARPCQRSFSAGTRAQTWPCFELPNEAPACLPGLTPMICVSAIWHWRWGGLGRVSAPPWG